MYTPSAFCQHDLATLHREIQACRLATLISQGDSNMQASHLPLLLRPE